MVYPPINTKLRMITFIISQYVTLCNGWDCRNYAVTRRMAWHVLKIIVMRMIVMMTVMMMKMMIMMMMMMMFLTTMIYVHNGSYT